MRNGPIQDGDGVVVEASSVWPADRQRLELASARERVPLILVQTKAPLFIAAWTFCFGLLWYATPSNGNSFIMYYGLNLDPTCEMHSTAGGFNIDRVN